jgi:hypothetical protein
MSQNIRLINYLQTNTEINPLTAWQQLGIYRLSARVLDLRKEGYKIKTESMTVKNTFNEKVTVANYRLEQA